MYIERKNVAIENIDHVILAVSGFIQAKSASANEFVGMLPVIIS
jgi:hypothetical protein